jgi:hypothetical protein
VSLRGTIKHALFLPSARRNFRGTPNGPGLCRVRAVWLNATRDVALQAIGSDSGILRKTVGQDAGSRVRFTALKEIADAVEHIIHSANTTEH